MRNFKWRCLSALMAGCMALAADAQSVIYPGAMQPGIAAVAASDGVFTLSNDLLSASFIREGNTLRFGGCEAMNLNPGTELFVINLGDKTQLPASQMTLKSVRTESLAADPASFKGSEHFSGCAVVAEFTGGGLNVEWRALLRDGSHYLRTEMSITPAVGDVAMSSIVAMTYDVENIDGNTAPVVVGNTRGAVVASNRIFAGLETPMGKNSVISATSGMESFTPLAWTPASFSWTPGSETPEEITRLTTIMDSQPVKADNVVAARGYVTFRQAGEQEITFQYSSGNHRLNVVGVDVLDPVTGRVISSDYHAGFTGGMKQDNVYKVTVAEAGSYIVRYFVETQTETIDSSGSISYSKKIAVPVVVFGDAPDAAKAPRRVLSATGANHLEEGDTDTDSWTGSSWTKTGADNVPARIQELGVKLSDVRHMERLISFSEPATLTVEFLYTSGNHRIDLCAVDLLDSDGNSVKGDFHLGFSGNAKSDNVYTIDVPYAGDFRLRYYAHNADNALSTNGNINLSYSKVYTIYLPAPKSQAIEGLWSRPVTLAAGKTWTVGAVVGLVAPDQVRRSVAAYVDRERAVAWRPFPVYISWFELNINRKDDPTYNTHMTVAQCVDVVSQWETNLYKAYGANIGAFVWDDGWDIWGTWDFNKNFPNGFKEIDEVATSMNTGIGTWLGPVGGYGTSGNSRRAYWSDKGGMQLSNPAYYDVFLNSCTRFINDYDFRFFKFDGISSLFAAYGPDPNNEEGAEAIIDIEQRLREVKPDIFLNTTVGTWASPFWYSVADATWRQENDYGKAGNNSIDREQWITYRDRLIYQNYVSGSPLCPINSIMSHGLILTDHERPCTYSQNYDAVLREMRCAFVSGASMVELYCDYKLLNKISGQGKKGQLWADMAECIFWQQNNADVLADIHWVGGNPWTGSEHQVYGWASWNGVKSTLALRNGDNNTKTFKTTLRQALDIPAHVSGTIRLKHSFAYQTPIDGLELDSPIDIDRELTLTLPGSSLFCFDGIEGSTEWPVYPEPEIPGKDDAIDSVEAPAGADAPLFDLQGRRAPANPASGLYIRAGHVIRL